MQLYKSQLLPYIEYRTPAIYHACDSAMAAIDNIQDRLLSAAGMSEEEALCSCKLAPLAARRDMAMLGLIHRSVLGKGPSHFREFFTPDMHAKHESRYKHRLQLKVLELHESDFRYPCSRPADYITRSAFGLIDVYNKLPASVVEASASVSTFQSALQGLLVDRAARGYKDWRKLFSPRWPHGEHPLDELR